MQQVLLFKKIIHQIEVFEFEMKMKVYVYVFIGPSSKLSKFSVSFCIKNKYFVGKSVKRFKWQCSCRFDYK